MSLTDQVFGIKESKTEPKSKSLTDSVYSGQEVRATDPKRKMKEWASAFYTPALELGGAATGAASGVAIGGFTGPAALVASPALGIAGAGTGFAAGARAAHGIDSLIGFDKTPEQQPNDSRNFMLGAAGELTGGVGNYLLKSASKMRTPVAAAPRLASEELAIAAKTTSPEQEAFQAARRKRIEDAMLRTETILPESGVSGSIQQGALEKLRNSSVGPELETMRQTARAKAAAKVDSVIPHNSKAADVVRKNLETHNASIEAAALAEKEAEARAILSSKVSSEQEKQAAIAYLNGEMGSVVPKAKPLGSGFQTAEQEVGGAVKSELEAARLKSKERFSSEEIGYEQPKFKETGVADESNPLTERLLSEKPPLKFSAAVPPETKLSKILGGLEGGVTDLPPLSYSDLRDISSAAGKAARTARNSDPEVAAYFGRIQKDAERTIEELLHATDPALVAEYRNINELYAKQHIGGFRQGESGRILSSGKEVGGGRVAEGATPRSLEDIDNAGDIIRSLGVKKAAERGGAESMAQVSEEELFALGQKEAGSMMKPYFDEKLAAIYQSAQVRGRGAEAIRNWFANDKNIKILNKYGLLDEYQAVVQKAGGVSAAIKELGTKTVAQETRAAVSAQTAMDTLKVTEPDAIYRWLRSPKTNSKQAVAELMRVSDAPEYRAGIKQIIKDGMKEDIINGANPFAKRGSAEITAADRRLQELLPQVFNKSERQTMLDFYSIFEGSLPVGTKGVGHKAVSGEAARAIAEDVAAIPLGYKGYWLKHGLLTVLDKLGTSYEEAAFAVLDKALVNPKYQRALLDMHKKGETGAIRKIIQDTYADPSFKMRTLRSVPGAAAATGMNEAMTNRESWLDEEYKP